MFEDTEHEFELDLMQPRDSDEEFEKKCSAERRLSRRHLTLGKVKLLPPAALPSLDLQFCLGFEFAFVQFAGFFFKQGLFDFFCFHSCLFPKNQNYHKILQSILDCHPNQHKTSTK